MIDKKRQMTAGRPGSLLVNGKVNLHAVKGNFATSSPAKPGKAGRQIVSMGLTGQDGLGTFIGDDAQDLNRKGLSVDARPIMAMIASSPQTHRKVNALTSEELNSGLTSGNSDRTRKALWDFAIAGDSYTSDEVAEVRDQAMRIANLKKESVILRKAALLVLKHIFTKMNGKAGGDSEKAKIVRTVENIAQTSKDPISKNASKALDDMKAAKCLKPAGC